MLSTALYLTLAVPLHGDKASSAYKEGVTAETENKIDAAFDDYKRAYELKPKDARYVAAYTRLRFFASTEHVHKGEILFQAGNLQLALVEFLKAVEIDASNTYAQQEARRTQQRIERQAAAQSSPEASESPLADMAEHAEGPVELQPISKSPITLRITENTKIIYKTIGSLSGINVLFDPEYTPRKISIEMDSVQLSDALQIVALASKTFWRPVTPNTIYVAAETAGKRREVEQSVMKTFYLNNIAATTDLADAANTIRSILDITRVQQVQSQNALIVRATPDQLVLAEKLLSDIDKARPEVMIDIAILEVSRDRLRTLGSTLPTSTSIALQPSGSTGGASNGSFTLNTLANVNASNFLISIPGSSFSFLMSDSNTKVIQNPQMRVLDNQQATLKIGDRVPIATGSFTPGVGGAGISPLVNTQFQYLDVGVNINITPRIHSRNEVTLKVGMEVSSVTGEQNIGGVSQPIIGQRRIEHETRLREGEVNLLGGILEDSETDSISGYPWLMKIPLLRYLFGQNQKNRSQQEIVFAITPHIVRAQEVTKQNLRAIDVGTPNAIELRHEISAKSPPATTGTPEAPSTPPLMPAQPQSQPGATPKQQRQEPALPSSPTAAGNASFSFEPTTVSHPVGSTFTVNVNITGAQNAFSVPLQINYDPKVLQIVDVSNGGFLGQDGQTPALVFRADTVRGTLQITDTRPPNSGGISGSGEIFAITLSAKAVGETVLDISESSIIDPSMKVSPAAGGDLLVTITPPNSPGVEQKNTPVAPQKKTGERKITALQDPGTHELAYGRSLQQSDQSSTPR
ncbi:MAG: type II and III secretion system protein [Acidobacteria bacterium]|nr:type II and III secretion system protein [Acidobacteriota bacterium]